MSKESLEFYRNRCEELEEQLRQLHIAIMPRLLFPLAWDLNRGETSILAALYTSPDGFRTKKMLQTCSDIFGYNVPGDAIVSTRIHGLRKKLKPFGIEITNRFAEGYSLSKPSRDIIKAAIANESKFLKGE